MLFFPEVSLDIIRWTLAFTLVVGGIILMANDLRRQTILSMFSGSVLGVFLAVLGVIVIVYPDVLNIIPIVLGVYIIVSSVMTLRLTTALKQDTSSSFYIAILTSVISIICGIILITNPLGSAIALTSLIGAVGIVYGVAGIIDLVIFRNNVDKVAKYLKSHVQVIEGEEAK